MNKIMKFLFVFLFLFLSVFALACGKEEENGEKEGQGEDNKKTPSLTISKQNYELLAGSNEKISAIINDSEVALDIIYESSDENVAKVENGKINALNAGNATITAYLKDYSDNKITLTVEVEELPTITISSEGDVKEVYTNETLQLTATISDNSTTTFTWESLDNTLASVDQNGLVTAKVAGTVVITAKADKIKAEFVLKISKAPNQYILNFNGGASKELYEASGANAIINVTSYNGNFWGGAYASDIFMSTQSSDPTATFSDRIYIGKNSETKFYEVINILKSGSSKWPSGAEYVLTISNSYKSFAAVHPQVELVEVGDVVFFDNIKQASQSKPVAVKFYKQNVSVDKIVYKQGETVILPTPTKLGNEFLGWVDKDGNAVTSGPSAIIGTTNVYASWHELNPVTALNINDFDTTITTGDVLQISASVSPADAYFKQVLYATSNKDIVDITNTGKITAVNAGTATITVQDYVGKFVKKFEITVNSISSIDITFKSGFDGVLAINETYQLQPTLIGALSGNITYTSSDSSVLTVDASGTVKAVKEGNAVVTIAVGSTKLDVGFTVNNLNTANKVDEVIKLIAENNFAVVDIGNACLYNDGRERYYKATYGSVNRFLATPLVIDEKYYAKSESNPNNHKSRRSVDTVEFVCVHDTATLTGTSESIASGMSSGETSIHYTVGNDLVWGVVPEKYIAYHAGDGTGSTFTWYDTGVAATEGVKPKFSIVSKGSGYVYACNGTATSIVVPDTGSTPTTDALLTYLGPTWKIENGKYYMGLTWWSSSYGKISSHGGNNNSIGIEMNVNTSDDSYDTWQRTAKLVADICVRNNIDTTRVQMHNTFSGKNCAQVFLSGEIWPRFMEMVNLEYTLQTEYKDVSISFKSNNPTIVGDDGRVVKAPEITTTVSYDVTVTLGSTSKTITLYSVIPGTTTWEQWSGTYASSVIWNKGHFSLNE